MFLSPEGPLVLHLIGRSVRVQEFLLLLLLLLSHYPCQPSDPALTPWLILLLLQMILQRNRPLANDHPEDPASFK